MYNLSKSRYCEGFQCLKILWLNKNKPEVAEEQDNEALFKQGAEVGELARGLFGEYKIIEFDQGFANMIKETEEEIKKGTEIIAEATFSFENNFCMVDILKNDDGVLDIYEVKSSTSVKDINLEDLAYQYYVLNALGYKINSINLVYINNQYYKDGEIDLEKFFKIEDLTEVVIEKQSDVKLRIESIVKYLTKEEEPEKDIGTYCSDPYDCKYWQYCTRNLPKPNIFDISGPQTTTKFKYYYNGMVSFEDLRNSDLKEKYLEQVIFELDDLPPKVEKEAIKKFLDGLYYPLYFLDFETFSPAIPLYDNTKAYMKVPFQYSVHYLEEAGGELKHAEFLGNPNEDPRAEVAIKLAELIPPNACVLAYNMPFEKSIIEKLVDFTNLSSDVLIRLENIHDNIQDLMTIFQKRNYYAKEFEGSYSIKAVLPTLFPNDPDLDYKKLDLIHDGNEAMNIYPQMINMNEKEAQQYRQALMEYCRLDTLAMVKIWEKLKELSK